MTRLSPLFVGAVSVAVFLVVMGIALDIFIRRFCAL